jgi:hypothetical protein
MDVPDEFVWAHGDNDGCDHRKMGTKGHQGVISVVVSDGHWACTAKYEGTNSSSASNPAPQPEPCKKL